MSSSIAVDWNTARRDGDDVAVNLATDQVLDDWWSVFMRVASQWESETRGQTWDGLALSPDGTITFERVAADSSSPDMRAYLDSLLEIVNRAFDQEQARMADERQQHEQAAAGHEAKLDGLADQLRSSGD